MNQEKQWPKPFVEGMCEAIGCDETAQLIDAIEQESPVSIRINPRKIGTPPADAVAVPWCGTGYYLPSRPPFTFDPLLHAGGYYVQEASSMFVEQAYMCGVRQLPSTDNLLVLDLCAAPGGKSTLLRSLLPDDAVLICNEPMPKRAQVLAENMAKWGGGNVIVTQAMPHQFTGMEGMFDIVLTDVPCSGEGMFRKDAEAVAQWSADNVELCWRRQRDILRDIWPALKPGGILIYSTCTYNHYEDEDNVEWIAERLGASIVDIPVSTDWGIVSTPLGHHFYPHRTRGEGFFCALLQKHKCDGTAGREQDCAGRKRASGTEGFASLLRQMQLTTRVIFSSTTDGDNLECVDVDYQQAVAYLRGEALRLSADAPRGIIQICYKGLVLGTAKNIGSRANNLYPTQWRIKSSYTKEWSLIDA